MLEVKDGGCSLPSFLFSKCSVCIGIHAYTVYPCLCLCRWNLAALPPPPNLSSLMCHLPMNQACYTTALHTRIVSHCEKFEKETLCQFSIGRRKYVPLWVPWPFTTKEDGPLHTHTPLGIHIPVLSATIDCFDLHKKKASFIHVH